VPELQGTFFSVVFLKQFDILVEGSDFSENETLSLIELMREGIDGTQRNVPRSGAWHARYAPQELLVWFGDFGWQRASS
jgi:hypothetical protein